MATISVAMLTHDETPEFRWLMQALLPARDAIDEIVVVDDFSGPAAMPASTSGIRGSRRASASRR